MCALSFYRCAWKQIEKGLLVLPSKSSDMYALFFCCGAWKKIGKGCQCCQAKAFRCTLQAFVGVHDCKVEKVLRLAKQQLWDVRSELLSGCMKANGKLLSVFQATALRCALWAFVGVHESMLGKVVSAAKQQLWDVRVEPLSGRVKANWTKDLNVAKQKLWDVCFELL